MEVFSNCCSAGIDGEFTNSPFSQDEGRCSDCKEMTNFIRVIEVDYIEQRNELHTQNGMNYTIYPMETY